MVAGLWLHKLQNPAYRSAFIQPQPLWLFMTFPKHIIWILPLICFFTSYYTLYYLFTPSVFAAPALIGKQLPEALQILSDNNINMRILSQKEDNDIQPGTIVSQAPIPHSSMRPHQSLFVVITKQAEQKKAPSFLNKKTSECLGLAQKEQVHIKTYKIPYLLEDICIGQLPIPDQTLSENRITLYVSSQPSKPSLLPSFKNKTVKEVAEFLKENNLKYSVLHARQNDVQHDCSKCVIAQQKPLAGSLIDIKKPLTIQLYVQNNL